MVEYSPIYYGLLVFICLFLLTSIFYVIYNLFVLIHKEKSKEERLLQYVCIVLAFLFYVIFQHVNPGFTQRLFSIQDKGIDENLMYLVYFLLGVLCSSLVFYLIKIINSIQEIVTKRLSIFLFSMLIILFIELYIKTFFAKNGIVYLVIGACFISGIISHLIFYLPKNSFGTIPSKAPVIGKLFRLRKPTKNNSTKNMLKNILKFSSKKPPITNKNTNTQSPNKSISTLNSTKKTSSSSVSDKILNKINKNQTGKKP